MKKFKVTITETLTKNVEIEAKNYKDAIERVTEQYYAEDDNIVLSDADYSGTDFEVLSIME